MRISDQEYNRLNVLKLLRRNEPLSRTELAQLSGLTGGSITEITGKLLARELLIEERMSSARPGRPRTNLRLNPSGAYALASFIGIDGKLVSELVDLRGAVIHQSSTQLPVTRDMEHLAKVIANSVARAVDKAPVDRSAIRCVGVALPAVVDTRQGVVHWMQTIRGTPYRVAEVVEEAVGLPVTIDNNTNVLARAEHWFGTAATDNFTLINLGFGISASHYRNGELVLGAHGLNSELGHGKVAVDGGLECSCGAFGCLDAYCSITGLVRQIAAKRGTGMPALAELSSSLAKYIADVERGEASGREVLVQAGTYLGIALANHINTFDPARIIVLSEQWDMPSVFQTALLESVDANVLSALQPLTTVEFRQYGSDQFHRGVAAMVLEQIYRAP